LETFVVIDFETTGLSPAQGARPTEVAAICVRDGRIHEHYQSLMNPGIRIPAMIEELTGISNAMVRTAPPVGTVMNALAEFVGHHPLVAHNAAFDKKFWDAELQRLSVRREQQFICSLLLARRIYPSVQSYKLSALATSLALPGAQRYHRALADAEVTAHLLLHMQHELRQRYQLPLVNGELMLALQTVPRSKVATYLTKYAQTGKRASI
jgi:DNA polymerase III subunit epsilon